MLTSVHPPFDVRIFHKECKSLVRAGYDVTLIAPHSNDVQVDGVSLKAVTKGKNLLHRVIGTVWQVYRRALQESADVYHFHDPELIPVGLLLRARGKRVIYDIHEDLPRSMPHKPYLPKWLGKSSASLIEFVENTASRFFSALMPATPAIAGRFYLLNRNTVIIYNYPMPDELNGTAVPWNQREPGVAFVGSSVTRQRGAEEMINAMWLLPSDMPATLELAGGFYPSGLEQELSTVPGWNRVRLHGKLDRAGIANLLGRVQVGLVVQHPGRNYVEGIPTKLFEYMAAGIPVVSADFPIPRQVVEEARCGLIVDPLNTKEISDAIRYLLSHPQEAELMGQRGQRAVREKYNWNQEEKKLTGMYATLVKSLPRQESVVLSPRNS